MSDVPFDLRYRCRLFPRLVVSILMAIQIMGLLGLYLEDPDAIMSL